MAPAIVTSVVARRIIRAASCLLDFDIRIHHLAVVAAMATATTVVSRIMTYRVIATVTAILACIVTYWIVATAAAIVTDIMPCGIIFTMSRHQHAAARMLDASAIPAVAATTTIIAGIVIHCIVSTIARDKDRKTAINIVEICIPRNGGRRRYGGNKKEAAKDR